MLLTWNDNSDNETGFIVEYSTNGSSWTELTTTAADAETYTHTTPTYGEVTHYYRVRAENGAGESSNATVTCKGLLLGLVAYWTLNEASGTRFDSVGGNDLTDNNTVGSGTGKLGTGALFEADDSDYLGLVSNADIEFGDSNFAVSVWFNPNSLGSYFIITKDNDPSGRDFQLAMFGGQLHWELFPSQNLNVNDVVQAATWQHAIGYHNADTNTQGLVYNGTDNTRTTSSALNTASTYPLRISSRDSGALHFDGLIDEVGIWRRTLSVGEIAALYNSGAGLSYPF